LIAKQVIAYAYKDWVVPVDRLDRDGNKAKKPILSFLQIEKGKKLPPEARHRWMQVPGETKYDITPCFVMAWIGKLILCCVYFVGGVNNHGIYAIY
jgi:hypothetical protein